MRKQYNLLILELQKKYSDCIKISLEKHTVKNVRVHDGNASIKKVIKSFGLEAEYIGKDTFRIH